MFKKSLTLIKELSKTKNGFVVIAMGVIVIYLFALLLMGNSNIIKYMRLLHQKKGLENEVRQITEQNDQLTKRLQLLKEGDKDLLDELSRKKLNEAPQNVYILKLDE